MIPLKCRYKCQKLNFDSIFSFLPLGRRRRHRSRCWGGWAIEKDLPVKGLHRGQRDVWRGLRVHRRHVQHLHLLLLRGPLLLRRTVNQSDPVSPKQRHQVRIAALFLDFIKIKPDLIVFCPKWQKCFSSNFVGFWFYIYLGPKLPEINVPELFPSNSPFLRASQH